MGDLTEYIPHYTGSKPEPASVSERPERLQLCPHCNGTGERANGAACGHCLRGAVKTPFIEKYYGLGMEHPSGDGGARIRSAADILASMEAKNPRRRLTRGTPVLAALMEEIEDAKRNHAARC